MLKMRKFARQDINPMVKLKYRTVIDWTHKVKYPNQSKTKGNIIKNFVFVRLFVKWFTWKNIINTFSLPSKYDGMVMSIGKSSECDLNYLSSNMNDI